MNPYIYYVFNFVMGGCLAMTLAVPMGAKGWLTWFLLTCFFIWVVKLG